MLLSALKKGEKSRIVSIDMTCSNEVYQRFLDLGFVPGALVELQNVSPLGDPLAFMIHNTLISLRKIDADKIIVENRKEETSC